MIHHVLLLFSLPFTLCVSQTSSSLSQTSTASSSSIITTPSSTETEESPEPASSIPLSSSSKTEACRKLDKLIKSCKTTIGSIDDWGKTSVRDCFCPYVDVLSVCLEDKEGEEGGVEDEWLEEGVIVCGVSTTGISSTVTGTEGVAGSISRTGLITPAPAFTNGGGKVSNTTSLGNITATEEEEEVWITTVISVSGGKVSTSSRKTRRPHSTSTSTASLTTSSEKDHETTLKTSTSTPDKPPTKTKRPKTTLPEIYIWTPGSTKPPPGVAAGDWQRYQAQQQAAVQQRNGDVSFVWTLVCIIILCMVGGCSCCCSVQRRRMRKEGLLYDPWKDEIPWE